MHTYIKHLQLWGPKCPLFTSFCWIYIYIYTLHTWTAVNPHCVVVCYYDIYKWYCDVWDTLYQTLLGITGFQAYAHRIIVELHWEHRWREVRIEVTEPRFLMHAFAILLWQRIIQWFYYNRDSFFPFCIDRATFTSGIKNWNDWVV